MNSPFKHKAQNTKPVAYHLSQSFCSKLSNYPCFDSYLAGLFEADGHIWIPSQKQGGKRHNPRFHITFHLKDYPLAEKILNQIGQGFIRQKPKQNACVVTVSSVKGLKRVIHMINGKMRTPKIYKLGLLIDWLNKNHEFGTAITNYKQDSSNLADNSWFAGFIDGDGSFGIRNTLATKNSKRRISCKFRLEQRMHDPITNQSYHDILQTIANFLATKLHVKQQSKTCRSYYAIAISSKRSICLLIDYLEAHSLLSSKLLDYKDWAKAFQLISTGCQYTEQGYLSIKNLKSSMNISRSYYNWDHLL
jgi:hypothetical protein